MSVLIKGMAMPKSCVRCSYRRGCCPAVNTRIAQMAEEPWVPSDHRHPDCPLIPVPPHGDLIDRKALVNNKYATFTIEEEGLWGVYRDKGVWLSAVENAPTIIPAEEGE